MAARPCRFAGIVIAIAAVCGLAAGPAQAAPCSTLLDNFDRADGTNVGSQWTEQAQDYAIAGNGVGQPQRARGRLLYNAASGSSTVCVDVSKGNSGQLYDDAGVLMQYASPTDNLEIRFQNNNDKDKFDTLYIYKGPSELVKVPLGAANAFSASRLQITVRAGASPGFAILVDRNFDGIPGNGEPQINGALSALASGTGLGLTSYGETRLDNFSAVDPVFGPSPFSGAGNSPAADKTKPGLGSLRLASTTFKAARSGASTSQKKRKSRAPTGTQVSYSLTEDSSVRFTVERKTSGRRVSGKCRPKTRKNAKRRRCARYVQVRGSFAVSGKPGKQGNSFTFRGRVGGKSLKAGSYRLTGQATDPAKNASLPSRRAFKIVR